MVATHPSTVNVVNLVNSSTDQKLLTMASPGYLSIFLFSIFRDEIIFSSFYFVIVYVMTKPARAVNVSGSLSRDIRIRNNIEDEEGEKIG